MVVSSYEITFDQNKSENNFFTILLRYFITLINVGNSNHYFKWQWSLLRDLFTKTHVSLFKFSYYPVKITWVWWSLKYWQVKKFSWTRNDLTRITAWKNLFSLYSTSIFLQLLLLSSKPLQQLSFPHLGFYCTFEI